MSFSRVTLGEVHPLIQQPSAAANFIPSSFMARLCRLVLPLPPPSLSLFLFTSLSLYYSLFLPVSLSASLYFFPSLPLSLYFCLLSLSRFFAEVYPSLAVPSPPLFFLMFPLRDAEGDPHRIEARVRAVTSVSESVSRRNIKCGE